MLKEVNDQALELDTYLQGRARERFEWLVKLGGFLAAAVPALVGVKTLSNHVPAFEPVFWVALASIIAGTGLFTWIKLFRQRDEV